MRWLLLISVLLLPLIWLRGGLNQELFRTAMAAAKLEFTGELSLPVSAGKEVIVRSEKFQEYLSSLENDGWSFAEQMGSGYFFSRGDDRMGFTCRQYSTRYRICDRASLT